MLNARAQIRDLDFLIDIGNIKQRNQQRINGSKVVMSWFYTTYI